MLYALNLHWAVSQENGKKNKNNEKKSPSKESLWEVSEIMRLSTVRQYDQQTFVKLVQNIDTAASNGLLILP